MNVYSELANEFKKRDNYKRIGAIVGKVESGLPDIKISIFNGQIILNKHNLFITDTLYKNEFKINLSGSIELEDVSGSIDKEFDARIAALKSGDLVMLQAANNNQEFFLIDKVRKLG